MTLRYADVRIGQTVAGEPLSVSAELIQRFAAATGAPVDPAGMTTLRAPTMLAALLIRSVIVKVAGPPGGIHARQSFTFHRQIQAGDQLTTRGTFAGKEERAGKNYVYLDLESRDGTGQLVMTGRTTSIWAG